MDIFRKDSRPAQAGPDSWFTGTVRIEPIIAAEAPGRPAAALVTFQPGARTNWHTHPHGQTLMIVEGAGLAQSEGGPVRALAPGDVVWFAPGERHWHGAAPDKAMAHVAIQAAEGGRTVDWAEPVADADYAVRPAD